MNIVLPSLVETTATRLTLHHLAEQVLSPAQNAITGEIGLEVVPDGFATSWFAVAGQPPSRLRVEGADLIREYDTGVERGPDGAGDRNAGETAVREPIGGQFDPTAAAVLYAWWALGVRVLTAITEEYRPAVSPLTLWPEHFDVALAVGLGLENDCAINLGFSPGDDFCSGPYVYAGPSVPRTGSFWNAPFGAYRTYDQIDSPNPAAAARAFLDEAIARLRTGATGP